MLYGQFDSGPSTIKINLLRSGEGIFLCLEFKMAQFWRTFKKQPQHLPEFQQQKTGINRL